MQYLDRHKQMRRRQNDQPDHQRLGCRRANIGNHHLKGGDWRRQQFINCSHEFWKIDAKRGVGHALHQHRKHDQAGNDEGAIGHVLDLLYARANGRAKNNKIQAGGNDRGDNALDNGAKGARHLKHVDCPDCVEIHQPTLSPDRQRYPRASFAMSERHEGQGQRC